jgi:serralysin
MVDQAFKYWGNVSGITFVKVDDNANMNGDIRVAISSGDFSGGGFCRVPYVYLGENNSAANDIWIRAAYDPTTGSSYGPHILIHEIGHALGLAHTHHSIYSSIEDNTNLYSVMSYIGRGWLKNAWDGYRVGQYIYVQQPAINDIKAIQYLYGMTPNYNNGNTTYTYTGPVYTTIYDSGGIDTIDVSGYTIDITLDLRGGMVSYIGTNELRAKIPDGNGSSDYYWANTGFPLGIAENTIIENAKTGSGNDTITCNNVANTIICGAGNDTVYGAGGNDILDGGTGTDTLTGGSGADIFVTRSGNGSANLADADIITDFKDGADLIGLDGLMFSQLTIEQGIDDYASHTVVSITATGEYLFIIQNIAAHSITAADFTTVNINFPSSASEGSNDHNINNNTPQAIGEEGALGSGENDFFDLGLRVETSDLSNLTLPETVAERSDLPAPDLSGLKDLVTDAAENLVMAFEPMTEDGAISANIESIRPIECKPISQLDLIIDTDWNPIQEELVYTSELG